MSIPGLSTAMNSATVRPSGLTQLSSGATVQQESRNSGQAKRITASLFASDNGYTKEDAIMKQWNKQGSFNLYEVMNGGKVNLQNPDPGAEALREFEKQLQANGIQKEVDWSGLMFDLKGIGFDADAAAYTIGAEDFSRKVDYLASRYAAAEDKIKSTATGDTQAEQLKKLDGLYQSALHKLADGYSSITGSFLEENGVNGEQEKLYASIVSGVGQKVEAYRTALAGHPAWEGLKGTQDQWLLDDDAYVAGLLRENAATPAAAKAASTDAPYTLDDLNALGQYVSELSAMEKPNNTNIYTMDEARIGLEFSMAAMKTSALGHSGRISEAMAGLLQKTVNGYMQSYLDRLDSQLRAGRNAGAAAGDKAGFAALDRSTVQDVYNQTMEHYRASGDAMQALVKGAGYGRSIAAARSVDGVYRYRNNQAYWAGFFDNSTKSGRFGDYPSGGSTFQKYLAGWADFKNSLSSGQVRMNLTLRPAEQYIAAGASRFDENA